MNTNIHNSILGLTNSFRKTTKSMSSKELWTGLADRANKLRDPIERTRYTLITSELKARGEL